VSKHVFPVAAVLILLSQASHASTVSTRAIITGGGGSLMGRCTIEVNVDGRAEVEISGDNGIIRTLSGRTAVWRRFQCNAPLPHNPHEFTFTGTDGRGTMQLLRDPRSNNGTALIQINDLKGGRDGYSFDLQWRGYGGGSGGPPPINAIRLCQDSVTDRLSGDGYRYVTFERIVPTDNPGRHDWVTGTVNAKREFRTTWFSFSCSVDFSSGRVRSLDIHRR
jgi:hypothetical protein